MKKKPKNKAKGQDRRLNERGGVGRDRRQFLDRRSKNQILSKAIMDTIRDPLVILDEDLRVILASKSFFQKFGCKISDIKGEYFIEINEGFWIKEGLEKALKGIISKDRVIEGLEINGRLANTGNLTILLDAQKMEGNNKNKVLLSLHDITEKRAFEIEREKLSSQKNLLLREMRHRIANSLQLIASILILKAGIVESEETRHHLRDAHDRILSIATVQKQLDPGGLGEKIQVSEYLKSLCKSLSKSMIGGRKPITLSVRAGDSTITSETAISLGLLTTELVINSIKHAFPKNKIGKILVEYEETKHSWTLSIKDNGVGRSDYKEGDRGGLGTSIVTALADQLDAKIVTDSTPKGTKVSFVHIFSK